MSKKVGWVSMGQGMRGLEQDLRDGKSQEGQKAQPPQRGRMLPWKEKRLQYQDSAKVSGGWDWVRRAPFFLTQGALAQGAEASAPRLIGKFQQWLVCISWVCRKMACR